VWGKRSEITATTCRTGSEFPIELRDHRDGELDGKPVIHPRLSARSLHVGEWREQSLAVCGGSLDRIERQTDFCSSIPADPDPPDRVRLSGVPQESPATPADEIVGLQLRVGCCGRTKGEDGAARWARSGRVFACGARCACACHNYRRDGGLFLERSIFIHRVLGRATALYMTH
jgi:hypothetical protein